MPSQSETDERRWLVLKFGGTSVSSAQRWKTIAGEVRKKLDQGYHTLVVCSALSQVSNKLERLLDVAESGEDFTSELRELEDLHAELADSLDVKFDQTILDLLHGLRTNLQGVQLTREATPRLRARVMATGELLSTRLGVASLAARGIEACWQDARELLVADQEPIVAGQPAATPESQFLQATCTVGPEPAFEQRLASLPGRVVVTQGFIARLPNGLTVLLGRGGSDTSAAYLAVKLSAEHLEIWTDVPGLFTANPRSVRDARLLRRLSYAETAEMASKGAKVLHPRCIRPAHEHEVPIHVRCTPMPHLEGTVIGPASDKQRPQIRAVSMRKGIVLLSMDTEGTWQQVGLIADLTAAFKKHLLSIDLLASSQTNFTVAIDPAANRVDDEVLEPLLEDLRRLCEPKLIRPTAAVSLVGTGIRAHMGEWARVMSCFEDEDVYLVAQAANDLSLTFVVNESSGDALLREIHDQLFTGDLQEQYFGPAWSEMGARLEAPV